jgi:hypothetical protein
VIYVQLHGGQHSAGWLEAELCLLEDVCLELRRFPKQVQDVTGECSPVWVPPGCLRHWEARAPRTPPPPPGLGDQRALGLQRTGASSRAGPHLAQDRGPCRASLWLLEAAAPDRGPRGQQLPWQGW